MRQRKAGTVRRSLRIFFDDYEWIHICLGILGNVAFFVGSIFFLWDSLKLSGVWLFIIGSFLMLIGAIGNGLVKYVRQAENRNSWTGATRVRSTG